MLHSTNLMTKYGVICLYIHICVNDIWTKCKFACYALFNNAMYNRVYPDSIKT